MVNLFEDLVPEEKQHTHYKLVKSDEYVKKVINSWADEKVVNRDGNSKFIKDFQMQFNPCLWELYIYACLKKLKCELDFSHDHPDYLVRMLQSREKIAIECTIAKNAKDSIPEHDVNAKLNDKVSIDYKVYVQTIRLANSIESKFKKYVECYSKEQWVVGGSFILALAPYEHPNSFEVGNEAILAVLYGELFDRNVLSYERVDGVIKQNDSVIPLGFFTNSNYRDISGVLFSSVATMGKVDAIGDNPNTVFIQTRTNLQGTERSNVIDCRNDHFDATNLCDRLGIDKRHLKYSFYREKITDGLTLYLNPYARNLIKNSTLLDMYTAGINVIGYDLDAMEFDETLVHDYFLVHRLVLKLNTY